MANSTPYELEKSAYREVESALNALADACTKHKVPLFASVAVSNSNDKTTQLAEHISPVSFGLSLAQDPFADYIRVYKHMNPTFIDYDPYLSDPFGDDADSDVTQSLPIAL